MEALAVGGVRFPYTLGEVLLFAAAAVRGGQQSAVTWRAASRAIRVGCWVQEVAPVPGCVGAGGKDRKRG